MKLLLTSTGLSNKSIQDALLELTKRPFSELKVAFIPNAADNYADKWFVIKDRNKLIELGMDVVDVDVREKTQQELLSAFSDCDVIFVAGGNTFYLLQCVKESGAGEIIKDLVRKGIIYIGSSAGSILVGPSLELIKTLDDPGEAPLLKSYAGLKLVDFVIFPHFIKNNPDKKEIDAMKKYSEEYKIIPISDEQAVFVEDGNFKIIGE